MSDRVRILVVGYRKFSELINALLPEFEQDADVTIVESLVTASIDYSGLVERHRADIIVSAGANAAFLRSTLSVPVLAQPVTDTDVLEALGKARKLVRRIHLFAYASPQGPSERLLAVLPDLLDSDIVFHDYSTADEASESLRLAIAEEAPEVIVGPSYICRLAEQQGLPTILSYSRDSARELLRRAIDLGRQAQATRAVARGAHDQRLVIHSPQMERVAALAQTYARGRAAVLLEGESGTGKEHIAREIHSQGAYAAGPLIAVNCGSIPNELFESELFGYVEGAFTGSRRGGRSGLMELADGGVLFLDEIGELPLQQQSKLLRALQERRIRPVGGNREIEVDFKLVAATNRDLREAVEQGDFRDDLFYRLNVFNLHLPPLRERREEVPVIARHYFIYYASEHGVTIDADKLLARVERAFSEYQWPGNIRELQNFAERLVVTSAALGADFLTEQALHELLPELSRQRAGHASGALKDLEASAIVRAMERFGGDREQVASYLGISPTTLWRRLKKLEASGANPIT